MTATDAHDGGDGPDAVGPSGVRAGPPADGTANPAAAPAAATLDDLDALVVGCRACPRLVAWREEVAVVKRAAFRDETYWARPVPGFGDPSAAVLVVGLAPAAHGANRTGRMFTGDRSGDFLFAAMHRTGFASQALSVRRDDGLTLTGIRVTAPVRCAPPANAPTPQERRTCGPFLAREIELVDPGVLVVLGGFGWQAVLATLAEQGWDVPRPRPVFGHGVEVRLRRSSRPPTGTVGGGRDELVLVGCFHVSQQNTFTGRLTPGMLDDVLVRARDLVGEHFVRQAEKA
ncbi:uracil-DNA glycosylase [Cellulomonas biazotea]|uniref:uracil-DNA glycosylase n=2 Tax=Cellulomonas biazotea TaxID=1709 RepID=UPI0035EA20BA